MNTTKEGIEVKIGQRWRDLDKRMGTRIRTVYHVENGKAFLMNAAGTLKTKVSINRMHKSATGWELVQA